jgi:uncharacterized RDD family membrane protein YckC
MIFCPNCGFSNVDDASFCAKCGSQMFAMATAAPSVPASAYPGRIVSVPYFVGFWKRFVAYLVDGMVLTIIELPIGLIFIAINKDFTIWGTRQGTSNPGLQLLSSFIRLIIFFTYMIVLTGRFQATLGKMCLGLKVTGTDMRPISYSTAAAREISKIVSAIPCMLGFIWAGFDPRK